MTRTEVPKMGAPLKTEVTTDREASRTVSALTVFACAWPALLLATACLVPYLNKAFVVDDPWFLTMAKQIVNHPAQPMDFTICWNFGPGCVNVDQWESGNALKGQVAQGYALVPAILAGAHEWTAHLTQLVLAWIAIVAMTSLIFRFGWDRPACNRRRSGPCRHSAFSSHGQHRHARHSRNGPRASGNGTTCCVEGRTKMDPGGSSRLSRASVSPGFARSHSPSCFFCTPLAHSF